MVSQISHEFKAKSRKEMADICQKLLAGPCMHVDAAFGRLNGKMTYFSINTNKEAVLFQHREHKSEKLIEGTPLAVYDKTVIQDGEAAFFHHGQDHQRCLVHEYRALQNIMDNELEKIWAVEMYTLLHRSAEIYSEEGCSKAEYESIEAGYDFIVKLGEGEYQGKKPEYFLRASIRSDG